MMNEHKLKEKYRRLSDELDNFRQDADANENLLCKAVSRMAIACKGLDSSLDQCLFRIRQSLKPRLNIENLNEALDSLSDTLVHSGIQPDKPSAQKKAVSILFEFLSYKNDNQVIKKQLISIEKRLQKGEFDDFKKLYAELSDATSPQSATGQNVHKNKTLFNNIVPEVNQKSKINLLDGEQVREHLIKLLDQTDIPANFSEQAIALCLRLREGTADASFQALLNDAINLLIEIKDHVQDEQHKIEEFLEKLTAQILELDRETRGVTVEFTGTTDRFDHFRALMSNEVEQIKNHSEVAHDLEQFKVVINDRLDVITEHIRKSKETEQTKQTDLKNRLTNMSFKVEILDSETRILKHKLKIANDKALRDPLTNLPNRAAYDERLRQEISRWQRFSTHFCLVIWDIDHFKAINDRFGHAAGDKALRNIAHILQKNSRKTDFLARFGGEEFVMILVGAEQDNALNIANNLRKKVENCGFNTKGKSVSITISCGLKQFSPDDTAKSLFEQADKALYLAKKQGRNQCVLG